MFEFFFKYPFASFLKGHFVLLGRWPGWALVVLIVAAGGGLAWRMWSSRGETVPKLRSWRAVLLWGLQSLMMVILLLLLWEPAMTVAELSSHQNIIAVVVDDSRSMGIADSGPDGKHTREAAAIAAMQNGVLAGLQRRFQTRIYRLHGNAVQAKTLLEINPNGEATHIGDGLTQLSAETSDLPIGAVVLLTDGAENSDSGVGGIGRDTMNALRNRRWPVHTVGFGKEISAHDVEVDSVSVASKAMADARVVATLQFHQRGYAGGKGTLVVRDAGKPVLSREVKLAQDGAMQTETFFFSAGAAGAKSLEFGIVPLAGEENVKNNAVSRPLTVSEEKRRILYVEGEPRWEYKFIRRAEDDDKTMQVVSMLRTTENKIYRQGISDPRELEGGFPVRPEDLFQYQGIIIGSVEAGYFTASQQELLREFVDRRGGGVLFLGGRFSLADGGWGASGAAELLPVNLPAGRSTFHRDPATANLTASGADSPVMRLVDDPGRNVERWKKLTYMMDYQDAGVPKPGATVLAEMHAGTRRLPLLVTQSYGRGRTAVMATSGTWRWQMSEALGDTAHDLFWQQLLRWVVGDTPGHVVAGTSTETLTDTGKVHLTASVRGPDFMPAGEAKVEAHVTGPEGLATTVDMAPSGTVPGDFVADWNAQNAGSYLAEITANGQGEAKELGRDVVSFQRTDGVAENFHTEQNREMLERLAAETGGRYWRPQDLARMPQEISYSEAGISVRDTRELWNMPAVFLLLLALLTSEWLLRRKWGVV